MSKSISIKEGGRPRGVALVRRLKVDGQDGSDTYWVPESERIRQDRYIHRNGLYVPAEDSVYGYRKLTVNVPGGAPGYTLPTLPDGSYDPSGIPQLMPAIPGGIGCSIQGFDPNTLEFQTIGINPMGRIDVSVPSSGPSTQVEKEYEYVMKAEGSILVGGSHRHKNAEVKNVYGGDLFAAIKVDVSMIVEGDVFTPEQTEGGDAPWGVQKFDELTSNDVFVARNPYLYDDFTLDNGKYKAGMNYDDVIELPLKAYAADASLNTWHTGEDISSYGPRIFIPEQNGIEGKRVPRVPPFTRIGDELQFNSCNVFIRVSTKSTISHFHYPRYVESRTVQGSARHWHYTVYLGERQLSVNNIDFSGEYEIVRKHDSPSTGYASEDFSFTDGKGVGVHLLGPQNTLDRAAIKGGVQVYYPVAVQVKDIFYGKIEYDGTQYYSYRDISARNITPFKFITPVISEKNVVRYYGIYVPFNSVYFGKTNGAPDSVFEI